MIEEVVNSILEAEDVAKERIAQAEQKAGEIVSSAENQADKIKKQASADNKAYLAEKLQQADELAEKHAREHLAELNAQTDAEIAQLEKRIDGAVKIILESL